MHKFWNTRLLAALALSAALPAFAQTGTPGLDKRQARQQERVDQGVKSGQLTPREAARLEKRGDRLEAAQAKAQSDGKVTKAERARLNNMADRNSQAIARQRHDPQKAK